LLATSFDQTRPSSRKPPVASIMVGWKHSLKLQRIPPR
jgi:hypothetical protein